MKPLKNQRGFAVLEAILLVVVLSILGFVGYQAYRANQTKTIDQPTTQQKSTERAESKVTVPEGWEVYSNTEYKFSFAYPDTWKLEDGQTTKTDSGGKKYTDGSLVTLISPDFKEQDANDFVFQGVLAKVFVSPNTGEHKTAINEVDTQKLKETAAAHGGTYGTFSASGYKGYWLESANPHSTGYHVKLATEDFVYHWHFYLKFDQEDRFVREFKPTLDQFFKTIEVGK